MPAGRPVTRPGLAAFILENETRRDTPLYMTNDQIAEKFGTTVGYVYRLRGRLRDRGSLREAPKAHATVMPRPTPKKDRPPSYNPDNPNDLLRLLDEEVILTREQRLKLLSRFIRLAAPALKLKAMDQLEDLTKHAENRIGPPPPTTFDGQVAELIGLMLMLPFDVVKKAYETVTTPESEAEEALQPPSDALSDPSPLPDEPLRDLPTLEGPSEAPSSGPLP